MNISSIHGLLEGMNPTRRDENMNKLLGGKGLTEIGGEAKV